MSINSNRHLLWPLAGTLTVLPALWSIGWWVRVTAITEGGHADMVEAYLAAFPGFLQHAVLLTFCLLALCVTAMYLFYRGLDGIGIGKFYSVVMLGFSGLAGFWLLFSLM